MKNNITMMQIFCIAVMGTDDESEANAWFNDRKKQLNGNGNFDIMIEQLDETLEKGATMLEYMKVLFDDNQAEYLDKLPLGELSLDEILEHIRKM